MSGATVDIISGRPTDAKGDQSGPQSSELLEKMQMVGLPQSAAAQIVARRVMAVLEEKIAAFLRNDPQAIVCLDVLRAIKAPEITAHAAARRYVKRFNLPTPALGDETTPEKEEMYP